MKTSVKIALLPAEEEKKKNVNSRLPSTREIIKRAITYNYIYIYKIYVPKTELNSISCWAET